MCNQSKSHIYYDIYKIVRIYDNGVLYLNYMHLNSLTEIIQEAVEDSPLWKKLSLTLNQNSTK